MLFSPLTTTGSELLDYSIQVKFCGVLAPNCASLQFHKQLLWEMNLNNMKTALIAADHIARHLKATVEATSRQNIFKGALF